LTPCFGDAFSEVCPQRQEAEAALTPKIETKMSNPQLRRAALRLGSTFSRRVTPAVTAVRLDSKRSFSVELKKWQELGYVDEKGLTMFDTLHQMQVRSCATYAENELFGTYTEGKDGKDASFQWMTFQEYATNVNKCRAVLKDIGTFMSNKQTHTRPNSICS
jgi:hypothetical protein